MRFAHERIQWTVRKIQNWWKMKDFVAFCEICSRTYSMNGSGNAEVLENQGFRCILWDLLTNVFNERSGKCRTGGKWRISLHFVRFARERIQWTVREMQKCWKIKDFVAFCEICSRTYSMNGPENAELVENEGFRCILWDLLVNVFNERFGKCRTGGKSSSRLVRFSAEPLIWFINSIY